MNTSHPTHVIFEETLRKAEHHWAVLMKDLGFPAGNMDVFNGILLAYGEPHRHYHVLGHIVAMLDEFEEVRELSRCSVALLLAIWFHDYVYDTGKRLPHIASNEARSAYYAKSELKKLRISEDVIKEVVRLIECTDHRQYVYDVDAQILLDLDLAVLGKEEALFDVYEEGIRKEYAWVPEKVFTRKRQEILSFFLSHNQLYYISFFRERYQKQAFTNLKRSLYALVSHTRS